MTKNKKIQYALVILVLIGVVIFSLREPEFKRLKKDKSAPSFVFEGVKITQIINEAPSLEINARYAEINRDHTETFLKDMDGCFYQNEQPLIYFQAKTSNLAIDSADMILNNASANFTVSSNQVTLEADTLYWVNNPQYFRGEGRIKLASGPITLFGDHFFVDVPIRHMSVSGNSYATIRPQAF